MAGGALPNSLAAPETADALVSAEQAANVREALQALPSPQRTALELAYFEGFSQAEIAQQLGEPLGTIKTRMRTALAALRARLRA